MNWQVIKIRIRKISFYTLATFLFLLLSSYITLQIPAVQNKLIGKYVDELSKITGFKITAQSFHLIWYDRLRIEDLIIIDPEENKLLDAKTISINFRFKSLLTKEDVNIDAVRLDQIQFNVHSIPTSDSTSSLNINVLIARINELLGSTSQTSSSPIIRIGDIDLTSSRFSYQDHTHDSISSTFNPHHFEISLHQAHLQNFSSIKDTIQFDLRSLKAQEETTSLDIHQFNSFFRLSNSSMEFLKMNLQAGNSIITDSLVFKFASQDDLSDFINGVSFQAHFDGTKISSDDLALFVPQVKSINQIITLRGKISGKVSRFQFEDMEITMGNTRFNGRLAIDGLPYLDESFINLKLLSSRIDFNDLHFLFDKNISSRLIALEQFQMNGSFIGFVNDFVARGEFEGKIGKVKSDINLKINSKNIDESTYGGNITLTGFDLGRYFKDTINFQKVSLRGRLDGKGFSLKSLDAKIDGTVHSIGIRGYPYSNIVTNARVAEELFSGKLSIHDPNLKLTVDGTVDFRETERISITAKLDTANFKNLGFTEDHLFVIGQTEINSTGLQLDSILGAAKFYHTYIEYRNEALAIDTLLIESFKRSGIRVLQLKSSLVDVDLEGTYNYSDLAQDVPGFFYEFYLNLKNSHDDLLTYYSKKNKSHRDYELSYLINLKDLNPLLRVINLNASISKETEIRGRFSSGPSSIFRAAASIKEIDYDGKKFLNNEMEITGSKERDSTNVLAIFNFNSRQQILAEQLSTKNLRIETIWNGPQMDGSLSVSQEGMDNVLRVQSYIDFLKDSTFIKLRTHQMRILGKDWEIDSENYIVQKGREWNINGLKFSHEDQIINLNGFISEDPEKELRLDITNLSLGILDAITTEEFSGIVNGSLTSKHLYEDPYFQNDFVINDLKVNNFLIGNVLGKNTWSQQKEVFDVQLAIDRLGVNTFNILGTYDPNLPSDPLALTAQLDRANLKIAEPVLKDIFSTLNGDLTGTFSINGTFGKPRITGMGRVTNGSLTVDYLKTPYTFEGNLELNPNMFVLNGFKLVDAGGNQASLEGFIAHRNFATFRISIDADFKNFNVLNTTEKDNSLFYGVANVTGNLNIFGPATNLKISATARSEKSTRLSIPVTWS
ncbi:MAG: hypothetical protein HC811_11410 [Flammeovirgaceae bacterium]|nr:hypothetical protein [Flammeovirgaceae bacterium]